MELEFNISNPNFDYAKEGINSIQRINVIS
jgi:hypothetical protein